jgi:hypothetical protein
VKELDKDKEVKNAIFWIMLGKIAEYMAHVCSGIEFKEPNPERPV